MTADALLVLRTLFGSIWALFNSWYIPGTNVTPAAFFIFLCCAYFALRILGHFSGGYRFGNVDANLTSNDGR